MASENRRLIKNTLTQYIRIIVSAICGLISVRILLQQMGIEDYGIYTIIGGFVAFLGILNATMTVSTQRFISVELAANNFIEIRKIYSSSVVIHLILSLIILVLAETIGLYAINHILNFPSDTSKTVNIVYQCTVFTFILNVLSVPQQAVLIAYEKIYLASLIGIAESILRLLAALVLAIISKDKLVVYVFLIFIISLSIRLTYNWAVIRHTGIRFVTCIRKENFTKLIKFAWWTMFGGLANIGKTQGVNIILNLFYGTGVNASFGIANQVNSQLMVFSSSIFQSSNSQTIQAWKNQDMHRLDFLILKVTKVAFILFLLITVPVYILTDKILSIWLGEVPIYCTAFIKLMLINSYIELFSTPLMFIMQASGKIKNYFLIISSILLCILPISYIFLSYGYSPEIVLIVTICINILILMVRILFCNKTANYDAHNYIIKIIVPSLILIFTGVVGIDYIGAYFRWNSIAICLISEILCILLCTYILVNKQERAKINEFLSYKISRFKI